MAFADGRTDSPLSFRRAIQSPLFLAVAALLLLLIGAEIIRPCFFLHDDNASSFAGSYVHDFRVLTETGRVAEVDYYQYGGEPFLEQGQTAVLYPPVYLGVALAKWVSGDVRWTIEWLAAMHLLAGLFGFYFWLRQGGVSRGLAALLGLTWVLNPFIFIIASSWIMVTYVAAWLPWLFWALDRLFARPTALSAFFLGAFLGLFFLQGYVQWVLYSALFLGLYAALRLIQRTGLRRGAILYHLLIAAVIFLILALPLMLPMFHAIDASAARSRPLSILQALFYRAEPIDVARAQVGLFQPHFVFGVSSAILFCAALWLVPLMLYRFPKIAPEWQRRLFPLLVLATMALLFSSRWHIILTSLPILERFRWPFKVFIFVDFFLIAAVAWSITSWSRKAVAAICAAFVLLTGTAVSLANHDGNFFSPVELPSSANPLPPEIDTAHWRVIAAGEALPEAKSYQYITHGFGTFYQVSSLGGYNPLLSRDRLDFALGIDFPNFFRSPITPDVRKRLEDLSVGYWIVDSRAIPFLQIGGMIPGAKIITAGPDQLILQDKEASPIVYSEAAPTVPQAFTYSGNSILIPIHRIAPPLEISVGPTDGWWYRIDHGMWHRAHYENDHLRIDFEPTDNLLEVSFFDFRFREGLRVSLYLIIILVIMLIAGDFVRRLSRTCTYN